jgi:hypothetical protein
MEVSLHTNIFGRSWCRCIVVLFNQYIPMTIKETIKIIENTTKYKVLKDDSFYIPGSGYYERYFISGCFC